MGNNKRGRSMNGKRKAKKHKKSESPDLSDDEFDKGKLALDEINYDMKELLSNPDFVHPEYVMKMEPENFDMKFIKSTGLRQPMLFTASPSELGMKMPDPDVFGVGNVLELIGPDRIIEVVQVKGQKGKTMKLGQFITYYLSDECNRNDLFNVLSLEFTLTKLADKVVGPAFVKEIDWVETYWPDELKKRQELNMDINGKNCSFSTFPKVQRYCLMSVKDCFTDFHVDFGGTSVWYHVLKGRKIFWIIEPTDTNLLMYEQWLMSDTSNKTFFGNVVEKCHRVELTAGNTFIIPSGWIHCVFTPQDSLVFGGNFLHNYAIPMQLKIVNSEDNLKIGNKYRYTYFKQMLWYVVERFVREATGRKYLKPIKVNPFTASQMEKLMDFNAANGRETRSKDSIRKDMPSMGLLDDNKTADQPPFLIPAPSTPSTSEAHNFGVEAEEDETDNPINVNVEHWEYGADGKAYEICYDSENDEALDFDDPNYHLMPYQTNLSKTNFARHTPVGKYNEDYLGSLTQLEKEGWDPLLKYMEDKVMSRKAKVEIPEGITRPLHLIQEFKALIEHIMNGKEVVTKASPVFEEKVEVEPKIISTNAPEPITTPQIRSNVDVAIYGILANYKNATAASSTSPVPSTSSSTKSQVAISKEPSTLRQLSSMTTSPSLNHLVYDDAPSTAAVIPQDQARAPSYNPMDTLIPLGQKKTPNSDRKPINMPMKALTPCISKFGYSSSNKAIKKETSVKNEQPSSSKASNPVIQPPRSMSVAANSKIPSITRLNPSEKPAFEYKSPLMQQARPDPAPSNSLRQWTPSAKPPPLAPRPSPHVRMPTPSNSFNPPRDQEVDPNYPRIKVDGSFSPANQSDESAQSWKRPDHNLRQNIYQDRTYRRMSEEHPPAPIPSVTNRSVGPTPKIFQEPSPNVYEATPPQFHERSAIQDTDLRSASRLGSTNAEGFNNLSPAKQTELLSKIQATLLAMGMANQQQQQQPWSVFQIPGVAENLLSQAALLPQPAYIATPTLQIPQSSASQSWANLQSQQNYPYYETARFTNPSFSNKLNEANNHQLASTHHNPSASGMHPTTSSTSQGNHSDRYNRVDLEAPNPFDQLDNLAKCYKQP